MSIIKRFASEDYVSARATEITVEKLSEHVTSWNDLTDKPFYEVTKAAIIEWDGTETDTSAKPSAKFSTHYLISTLIPTFEQLVGATITYGTTTKTLTESDITESTRYPGCLIVNEWLYGGGAGTFVVVYDAEADTTFPTNGIYADTAIKIEIVATELATIDEKFIPDSVAKVEDVTQIVEQSIEQLALPSSIPIKSGTGGYSIVLNGGTTADGYHSLSEGEQTSAYGRASHAEGFFSHTNGRASHAEGYLTTASSDYQHTQGILNIEDDEGKYAHIVGNGYIADGTNTYSNAHTLDWEGNGWFQGEVYVGGTGQDDGTSVKLAKLTDIPDAVIKPTTAAIGQTIVVKAVDDTGKPTEWECVNIERPFMTQVTLITANWDDSTRTQNVTVSGILADTTAQNIQCNPVPASMYYAIESGLYCSAQADDALTFSCSIIPTEDITLNVVW